MNGDELYDVNKYSDEELYNILDLVNPTDRELEAKIFHMIRKYENMQNESGNKLAYFFNQIYERFFEVVDTKENKDMIEHMADATNDVPQEDEVKLTKQLDYIPGNLNPILKNIINRTICIDSTYRSNKSTTLATEFSFNLSETLKNVVALRLQSIQLPITWYTISKSYGANFFYLKGNSPGIYGNSNHDYKISILPGNYTAEQLITAINYSISNIKTKYTDASFGETTVLYNDADTAGQQSAKATMVVDITKTFNETNFALEFPDFTYPVDGMNSGNFTSIPQLLGYDISYNLINSIYSQRSFSLENDEQTFTLSENNNYFSIVNYNCYDSSNNVYIDATNARFYDLSYETIVIKSNLTSGSYMRSVIVNDFNTQLQAAVDLSGAYIEKVNVVDASMQDVGSYYYKFVLPLNRKKTTNSENTKTVVLFPNDDTLWLGSSSCFQFDTSMNEVSNLKGSADAKTSDYTVGENVYFVAQCNASGYRTNDFSDNDVRVDISSGDYNLTSYISAINKGIFEANSNNFFSTDSDGVYVTGFSINSQSSYKVRMRWYMNKKFTTNMYSFDASGYYFGENPGESNEQYYNFSSSNVDNLYTSTIELSNTFTVNNGTLFKINPSDSYGNRYADPFDISLNCIDISNNYSFSNSNPTIKETYIAGITASDLSGVFNYVIKNWTDPVLGIQPLSQSNITYEISGQNITFSLDLSVNVVLTDRNYNVVFTDDNDYNSWNTYLFLNSSYNLSTDASYNYTSKYGGLSYSQIDGDQTIYGNMLTLYEGSNNYFYISPVSDGITDTTNANRITVTIPASATGTKYSVNTLIAAMQIIFDNSDDLVGSSISKNDSNIVTMRINHSKSYYTSDYRIVFYDPYSFVRCFTGAKSVKNTSWDTTLGWILGFRELTEYPLGSSYITYDANDTEITYYGETSSLYTYSSNIASIVGDTTVSVNLYNYFMIVLTDYTQNHLNDGLVTITPAESNISTASFANRATYSIDPVTGNTIFTGATLSSGNQTTEKQVYAENQKLIAKQPTAKIYSTGPFTEDIFGMIPLGVAGATQGTTYVETSSFLNKQERLYFGPVNIKRMSVKLITDRGDTVDLNGSDWSFSLQCDQLYQIS